MKNNLPNSYSRVVYKNKNDTQAQELLNSYRYQPNIQQYKQWSPEIAFQERFKAKREREDNYLARFKPQERPILVVEEKEEFKIDSQHKIQNDEHYYKITEHTDEIENVESEINKVKKLARKNTILEVPEKKSLLQAEGLSSVYKIAGKEFLPKGFIELDPILQQDDYEFVNKEDRKLFEKEQRKVKALRRKQYLQRKKKKIRDVKILVVDETKNQMLEFLNTWYNTYKRKMDMKELAQYANELNVDIKKLQTLQDMFFEQKRLQKKKQKRAKILTRFNEKI